MSGGVKPAPTAAELEASLDALNEIEFVLLGARSYLRGLSHDGQPHGPDRDSSSVPVLVERGILHVEENEVASVRALLFRLAEDAGRSREADHADA